MAKGMLQKMRASFVALMITLLCTGTAFGQGLEERLPLCGERCWPDGVDEQAAYIYRYTLPQFAGDGAQPINAYYSAIGADMADAMVEQNAQQAQDARGEGMPPQLTELGYRVTRNDDRYLSVILTSSQLMGSAGSDTLSAMTFARDGIYAGQPLTLSQVLGLEQEGDELSTEESLAERLAYQLVWQNIQQSSQQVDGDYLDGLSEAGLRAAFSPESDFYLDLDGNIVFFIQAGVVAGEVAGILTFPFSSAELLSAA
ncbi:MAG: hypothetical protein RR521_03965 [Clostridia bacterium]